MEPTPNTQRLGPIELAPGISRMNVMTKLYAAFITIAMTTGMNFMQGYILTEHLHIPRAQQGSISGNLSFWTEIVCILLFTPFGILADRIGRRAIYVVGILTMGLGYGLFPFAISLPELMVCRLIYAVGLAATAGMMATLTNDYPAETSRGKLIGITSMMNILGTMFMAGGVARIPHLLTTEGVSPVIAGQVAFLVAAGLCGVTAVVAQLGLKGGTPVAAHRRPSVMKLATAGLRAARNPRIAMSYAAAFAARSDLVITGIFLTLWAIHDGATRGMSPAQSMGRFGLMTMLMHAVSFFSAPIFGWFMDNVNRMTATVVALIFASAGYLSMALISSPLDFAMAPYLVMITLGSSFMMKSSLALVGQEAPIEERGSVVATNGMFAAIGILVMTIIGGRLFDAWGPWAPFVVAGAYQAVLLVVAIVIRIVAPGPNFTARRRKALAAALAAGNPAGPD